MKIQVYCEKQQQKFKQYDGENLCLSGRKLFGENPDGPVITARFHGNIENAGFSDGTQKQSRGHGTERTAGGPEILVSKSGILSCGNRGGDLHEKEDEPVD